MSAEPFYKQCELRRENTVQVAWIPEKFAHVGDFVGIKDDGVWVEGWEVMLVGRHRVPESEMRERSQDYKHQRKMSDI